MSTFSQNPDPATTFDEIVTGIPTRSVWEVMFDDAEERLNATRPEGFDTEEIGREAWRSLPPGEREKALGVLFYTYWAAVQNDAAEMARYEREHGIRSALRERLAEFDGLDEIGAPVGRDLLTQIATLANELLGGGR